MFHMYLKQLNGDYHVYVYGHPIEKCRINQCSELVNKGSRISEPWLCIGDFNDVMTPAGRKRRGMSREL